MLNGLTVISTIGTVALGIAWYFKLLLPPASDAEFPTQKQKHFDSKAYLRAEAPAPPLPPVTPITSEQRAALAAELFPTLSAEERLRVLDIASLNAQLDALSLPDCDVRGLLDLFRHPLPAGDSPSEPSASTKQQIESLRAVNPRRNPVLCALRAMLISATAEWGDNEAARVALARELLDLEVRADCVELGLALRDPALAGVPHTALTILPNLMCLDRRDDVIVARECLQVAMQRSAESPQPGADFLCFLQRLQLGRAFEYTGDQSASASQYRAAIEPMKQSWLVSVTTGALRRLAFVTSQDPQAGKGVALSYAVASLKLSKDTSGSKDDADSQSTVQQALALPPQEDLSPAAFARLHSDVACLLAPYSNEALKAPMDPKPFAESAADDAQRRAASYLQIADLMEKEDEETRDADLIARATAAAHREAAAVRYRK